MAALGLGRMRCLPEVSAGCLLRRCNDCHAPWDSAASPPPATAGMADCSNHRDVLADLVRNRRCGPAVHTLAGEDALDHTHRCGHMNS